MIFNMRFVIKIITVVKPAVLAYSAMNLDTLS